MTTPNQSHDTTAAQDFEAWVKEEAFLADSVELDYARQGWDAGVASQSAEITNLKTERDERIETLEREKAEGAELANETYRTLEFRRKEIHQLEVECEKLSASRDELEKDKAELNNALTQTLDLLVNIRANKRNVPILVSYLERVTTGQIIDAAFAAMKDQPKP